MTRLPTLVKMSVLLRLYIIPCYILISITDKYMRDISFADLYLIYTGVQGLSDGVNLNGIMYVYIDDT